MNESFFLEELDVLDISLERVLKQVFWTYLGNSLVILLKSSWNFLEFVKDNRCVDDNWLGTQPVFPTNFDEI